MSRNSPRPSNSQRPRLFAPLAGSANSDLKNGISRILMCALNGSVERYRCEKRYIRWGLVEREIHALIDDHVPHSPNSVIMRDSNAKDKLTL